MVTAAKLSRPVLPPLLDRVDHHRIEVTRNVDRDRRAELGQFLTPPRSASFMASLFQEMRGAVRVLDAGAGVGTLLGAFVAEACHRPVRPSRIHATAFEVDAGILHHLNATLDECREEGARVGVKLTGDLLGTDFIRSAVEQMDGGLFGPRSSASFTHAILNPPYKKLHSDSATRTALRRVGIETSNLYTAFLALAIRLLAPGGEIVAISPRSFCNGPSFRPFRELLLRETALQRVHVFESRTAAFAEDEVLQENVIFHAVKGERRGPVTVSSSTGPEDDLLAVRSVPFDEVVHPGDAESFIHVVPDDTGKHVAGAVAKLPQRLEDLGVSVSTGKVVDFRAREFLRREPEGGAGPLIYPAHFSSGIVGWPKAGKKPNALADAPETADLWMPAGVYVLVKRFSSKEERRRIVAAMFDPDLVPGSKIGFENHLNVLHRRGEGLPRTLALGLVTFLNSSLLDTYFRQYSGHTQVNATDLRNSRYPSAADLEEMGRAAAIPSLPQDEIDRIVLAVLRLARS